LRQGGVQLELRRAAHGGGRMSRTADAARAPGPATAMQRCRGLGWLLLLGTVPAAAYEREPVLHAADLVSPSLLAGPGWTVAPEARVVGYQARFTLRTRFGEIEAESVEMLALRVAELPAVEAVHDAAASAVAARAASAALRERGAALAHLARHPVRTLAGLPQGVARYFGQRLRRLGERARKLGDRAGRKLREDGDPYDHVEGAMAAARRDEHHDGAWHDKPRREVLNLAKGELDFGRARRAWAQRLGIDPQTSNPLLRPRLDALSWVAVGAEQTTSLGLAAAAGPLNEVLDVAGKVHGAVWQLDPLDLRARNRARISPWCEDEALLRRFLQHKVFNAGLQTQLVEATRALAPAAGCEALLETALMAATEQEARFVVNALRLLQHHLGARAAGGELRPLGASLAFVTRDGELLLPLAVDHLSWTAQMEAFFDGGHVAITPRTLLVTGVISLPAQRELTARGWSLVPHLPYPDAPPYAPSPAAPVRVEPAIVERRLSLQE
jgi:hypothetical protein